jgi:hypothetical protein
MTFDSHANFVTTLVATPPSPAASGTSLVVTTGTGSNFPATPFNCIVYPANTYPNSLNTEIIRVITVTGDTLTITRIAENSNPRSIITGDVISLTLTSKSLTDIETVANSSANFLNVTSNAAYLTGSIAAGSTNTRYDRTKGWQFYNFTTAKWHTLLCVGNPPVIAWDSGNS